MHRTALILALTLCITPGFGQDSPAAPASSFEGLQDQVHEHVLDNGLRLLILERHEAPVVSFATAVNVGSVNEHVGITGVAHVFEHMAFKGSTEVGTRDAEAEQAAIERLDAAFLALREERLKGARADAARLEALQAAFAAAQAEAGAYVVNNEFSVAWEQAGVDGLNAGTSTDYTIYFSSFPSNKTELWFLMESDRFINPVLREFYREKDVVMEERRSRTDSRPTGRLIEEFLAAAFKAHPYGQPTVGHRSDLEHLTREQARDFYATYYIPNNTTVAIVGDVDPAELVALAERYFAPWKRGPQPPPVGTVEPPQDGEKRISVEAEAQPLVGIGYHRPGLDHPDDPVYDVIDALLSGGRSARLYRSLVKEKKLALSASAFTGMPGAKYPNLFCFIGVPALDHGTAEVEQAIYAELERLKNEPVGAQELEGVKTRVRAGFIRGLQGNGGLAQQLAMSQIYYGDWRQLFRALGRIEAVSAADVQRVARTTFVRRKRVVGTLVKPEAAAEAQPAAREDEVEVPPAEPLFTTPEAAPFVSEGDALSAAFQALWADPREAALRAFVEAYPTSRHRAACEAALELTAAAGHATSDDEQLRAFLAQHPDSLWSGALRRRLYAEQPARIAVHTDWHPESRLLADGFLAFSSLLARLREREGEAHGRDLPSAGALRRLGFDAVELVRAPEPDESYAAVISRWISARQARAEGGGTPVELAIDRVVSVHFPDRPDLDRRWETQVPYAEAPGLLAQRTAEAIVRALKDWERESWGLQALVARELSLALDHYLQERGSE